MNSSAPTVKTPPLSPRLSASILWGCIVALSIVNVVGLIAPSFAPTQSALLAISPIALVTAIVIGLIIAKMNSPRVCSLATMGLSFVVGIFFVPWLSLSANEKWGTVASHLLSIDSANAWAPSIGAPITEEATKALCVALIVISFYPKILSLRVGAVIGACVGAGFQLAENMIFTAQGALSDPQSDFAGAMQTIITRSTVGFFTHWVFSALTGVAIVALLVRLGATRLADSSEASIGVSSALGLFVFAWLCHAITNSPLIGLVLPPFGSLLVSVIAVGVLIAVMRKIRRNEGVKIAPCDASENSR